MSKVVSRMIVFLIEIYSNFL